jgi:hypothetical protein
MSDWSHRIGTGPSVQFRNYGSDQSSGAMTEIRAWGQRLGWDQMTAAGQRDGLAGTDYVRSQA